MAIHTFKELVVWQKAMKLVADVYCLTKAFPKEETYGLTSQIRRSAVSIPSNIAEGRGKRSTKDFIRFLNIAYGSSAELETQLILSETLGFTSNEKTAKAYEQIFEINRMINAMIQSLEKKLPLKC